MPWIYSYIQIYSALPIFCFFIFYNRYFFRDVLEITNNALLLNFGVLFIIGAWLLLELSISELYNNFVNDIARVAISVVFGFLLFTYNLKGCIKQKNSGTIWWPQFLMSFLICTTIMVFSFFHNDSRDATNLLLNFVSIFTYPVLVIYWLFKLLKKIDTTRTDVKGGENFKKHILNIGLVALIFVIVVILYILVIIVDLYT